MSSLKLINGSCADQKVDAVVNWCAVVSDKKHAQVVLD